MATKNSINNASQDLTIDPGASGDSYIQFDINGTGEYRVGVDDTDSDKFKISQGSALGTNDTFVMTSAGERTMPLQPAFLAYNSSSDANATGAGTVFTCEFDTEVYDQGSDYNNTTDTFTAPVTGRYVFDISVIYGLFVAADEGEIRLVTSNRTYTMNNIDPTTAASVSNFYGATASVIADMDASDTATVALMVDGEASDLVSVFGASTPQTFFCGQLVC